MSCRDNLVVVAILSLLTGFWSMAASAASPEIRGTWITTTSNDDWTTANIGTTMSSLKQVGLNTVYVQAWKNGYTNFTSGSLAAFTGVSSTNSGITSPTLLADARTAAASAGLVMGAWFEYGMMAQFLGNTGTATGSFNALAKKCRDATWTVGTTSGTGWLLKDSSGNYTTAANGFVWMNPLVPEVKNLIKGIAIDAVNQFDLQIVQFDDHLAWPVAFGWDSYTAAVYKQETNRNLPASSSDANFLAWRQGKTQALFSEISDAIKAVKPSVIVSLAPSPITTSSSSYCANWSTWLGKTDEVLPQVYRSTIASFNTDWPGQITASGTNDAELGAGLRLLGTGSATPWNDLQQQIDRTRSDGALGHAIWYSDGISNSGTSNPDNYRTQLTAYYDVATTGPAANPHFTSVRWSGSGGSGGNGTWSTLAATWKDRSTIWVQDAVGIFDGVGGTVTVSGTVGVAGGLDFRTAGYTVSGGTIALRGYTRAANAITVASGVTATIASPLTGTTGLTKSGSGTLVLSGSNPFTGATLVSAGTLSAAAAALQGTTSIGVDGGVLVAAGYNPLAPLSVAASGSASISGTGLSLAAVTNSGSGSRGIDFTAATGTITLAGLSGTGATRFGSHAAIGGGVSAGTVSVVGGLTAAINGGSVAAGSLTSGTVNGGTVSVTGSASVTRFAGGVATFGGPTTIGTMASGSVTLSGSTASITTLSGGRVALGGAAVTVSGGTFAGSLSGTTGSLWKSGTGTLALAGTGSMSAPTSVLGGVLRLDAAGPLSASSVTPLAGGTLTIASRLVATVGGLVPNAGGLTDVRDGAITAVSGLAASDLVTALRAGRGDGSWTGTSGITSSVAAAAVASSTQRSVGWLVNGNGSLTFAYAAPGDTNLDWQVDIVDAANLVAFGTFAAGLPATWAEGDFNYDGIVDVLDVASFLTTGLYDTGVYNGSAAAAIAAVPEPTLVGGALMAIVAIMAHAAARRRRRGTRTSMDVG